MVTASSVISLSERLRHQSQLARREGRRTSVPDLRLAILYLRRYAALLIIDESQREPNPVRRRELEHEAAQLWLRGGFTYECR
jgi:hypothetical protein